MALGLIALLLALSGCGGGSDEGEASTIKRPSADPPAYHQTEYDVETTWPQESSDKHAGDYLESVWHDPALPEFKMVIDSRPSEGTESPLAGAELTRLEVQRMSGYKEFSFKKAKLGQNRAIRWTYQVGDMNYFTYFLSKCGVSFIAAPILPSKGDYPGAAPAPVAKVREKEEVEEGENADVELISLEDVEEEGKDDDETAGIEDVDLGEDAESADAEEDDTFLVVEEEEGDNVSGLLDSGPSGGKEGEEEV